MTRRFSKHVPIRTCLGCRIKTIKQDLVRIVRTKEGAVRVDTTGTGVGRGVYVCPRLDCCNSAFTGRRLENSLRTRICRADLDSLANSVRRLNLA